MSQILTSKIKLGASIKILSKVLIELQNEGILSRKDIQNYELILNRKLENKIESFFGVSVMLPLNMNSFEELD